MEETELEGTGHKVIGETTDNMTDEAEETEVYEGPVWQKSPALLAQFYNVVKTLF